MMPRLMTEIARRLEERFGVPARSDGFLGSVAQNPLDTLIKTVLSQATNDRNSEKAFLALKQAYPSWDQVASASDESIATLIKVGGLGLQKASRIKAILASLCARTGTYDLGFLRHMSTDEAMEFLLGLDGVGPKTAACTLLFSFGRPVFPVDTHIQRIAKRLGLVPANHSAEKTQRDMQQCVPDNLVEPLHVNLIELGRHICNARKPDCQACPLSDLCPGSNETVPGRKFPADV